MLEILDEIEIERKRKEHKNTETIARELQNNQNIFYHSPYFSNKKKETQIMIHQGISPDHQHIGFKVSKGSANGSPVFEGERGGYYFINSSGNRAYIPPYERSKIRRVDNLIDL